MVRVTLEWTIKLHSTKCGRTRERERMFRDKVVIITGASYGIGAATAKQLAAKGAKVVLGARRRDQLEELARDIQKAGGQAASSVLAVTSQPTENSTGSKRSSSTPASWRQPLSAL